MVSTMNIGTVIGFDYTSPLVSSRRNMPSAASGSSVIDNYISSDVQAGRTLGPFSLDKHRELYINRMGVIPKGHTPGKWQLISDLSHPEGMSVNDGIRPDLCSLH